MSLDRLAWCYLIGLSAYHLFSGSLSYFAPETAMRFYRHSYGCEPIERRHLMIILRPWGALAIFAGFCGFAAVWHPDCRYWIESGFVGLLALRIGYRVKLRSELHKISGITPRRNGISLGTLLVGVAIFLADLVLHGRPV